MELGRSLFERPPLLKGREYKDYMYWKVKMTAFIQAMDYDMWILIKNEGLLRSNTTIGEFMQLDAKAKNVLLCALDDNAIASVYRCNSAMAMWNMLELQYEGNARVKQMKIQMLTRNFEELAMKSNESIDDFFTRLFDITNALNSLGMTYPDDELGDKILGSLSKQWLPKRLKIHQAINDDEMTIHELIGYLKVLEMKMKGVKQEEQ